MLRSATPKVAAHLVSTSYEKDRPRVGSLRVGCRPPLRLLSVRRELRFDVLSKNPASRAARKGTRRFHARARPLSSRDRVIPVHRESEFRAGDSYLSRANSILVSRPGKALHL